MKLVEHYLHLISSLSSDGSPTRFKTTIEEIAGMLCCTKRHAKHILKTFQDKEWVIWDTGIGRGKRSLLTFLLSRDEVIRETAKELVREGKYDKALEQMSSVSALIKENFLDWLTGQLGYRVERKNTKETDILRYPFYNAITTLDPARVKSRHEVHMIMHLFDTLLKFNGENEQIEPHLAHYWEERNYGRVWTFYLRKGVRFHHGHEMTANDVKDSFERLRSMDFPNHDTWIYSTIQKINVIRSMIVEFVLSESNYLFPQHLCNYRTSILPMELCNTKKDSFFELPLGTGPFKIVKNDESMMVLEAFDFYFQGRAHLDRVEILTLPEPYSKSDIPIYYFANMGNQQTPVLWENIQNIEQGAAFFTFNLNKSGPQQNPTFRKTIYLSLDLKGMCEELGNGQFLPACSFLPGYSQTNFKSEYNPTQAKRLFRKAGYNGELLRIYATSLRKKADHEPEALWIQTQLKKVGIVSRVEVVPIEKLASPDYLEQADIVVAGNALNQNIIFSMVKVFLSSTAFISNMVSPPLLEEINNKIGKIKQGNDRLQQQQWLTELEQHLRKEHALLFLHHRIHSVKVNQASSIQGASLSWAGRVNYKDLWFRAQAPELFTNY
jgi:SgrR family transcriptional regulator